MGKGANKGLLSNAGYGQSMSSQYNKGAGKLFGFLDPTLQGDVTNPQGFGARDLAAMNTASQQSLGGSVAGITGEGNLEATRTRNAGGFSGAIGEATRNAERQLSQNALNVQVQNALVKQQQREQALKALTDIYGMDINTALGYLNASTGAYHAENQSHPIQSGFQTGADVLNALRGGAQTGYNIQSGGGGGST